MPAPRTGFQTIPGHLTHYLDELDLTRKDLASALGVRAYPESSSCCKSVFERSLVG
ncbi:hypothetical protein KOR42_53290 [Thalassoglobus neptunius]|uniref:Uncharacterized protein n=1 Tax=Thalassoglobus neptunius TaxID=1938619 RepID=A0A5C5VBL3_9PLAN|nr:hypothetical protein KOR42_53290 [Thalassoglobus neptunius]